MVRHSRTRLQAFCRRSHSQLPSMVPRRTYHARGVATATARRVSVAATTATSLETGLEQLASVVTVGSSSPPSRHVQERLLAVAKALAADRPRTTASATRGSRAETAMSASVRRARPGLTFPSPMTPPISSSSARTPALATVPRVTARVCLDSLAPLATEVRHSLVRVTHHSNWS